MPASELGPLAPTPPAVPREREPPRHRLRQSADSARAAPAAEEEARLRLAEASAGSKEARPRAADGVCREVPCPVGTTGGLCGEEGPDAADGGTSGGAYSEGPAGSGRRAALHIKEGSYCDGASSGFCSEEEPDGEPDEPDGEPRPDKSGSLLDAEVDGVVLQDSGDGNPGPQQSAAPSAPRRKPVSYGCDDEARELAMRVFRKLDEDGSGYLSSTEMELAREVMLRPSTSQGFASIIEDTGGTAEVDVDGDGFVDPMEWHTFMFGIYGLLGRSQFLHLLKGWLAEDDVAQPGRPKAQPLKAHRAQSLKAATVQKVQPLKAQRAQSLKVPAAAALAAGRGQARRRSADAVLGARAHSGNLSQSRSPGGEAAEAGAAEADAAEVDAAEVGAAEASPATGGRLSNRRESCCLLLLDLPEDLLAGATSRAGDASSLRSSARRSTAEGDAMGKRSNRGSYDTTAVGKRSSGTNGDAMTAQDTLNESRDKQPLTTVEELWDLLRKASMAQKDIELDTFVSFFDTAMVLDVSRALARVVPYDGVRGYAVDMTHGRMWHLCALLVQLADLSLLEACALLRDVDENLLEEDELPANRVELRMSYKAFRKLLEFLPGMMHLQQEVIIALLAWQSSGRLELPEPIIVQIMMTFGGNAKQTKDEVPRTIVRMDTRERMEKQWSIINDGDSDTEQEQKQQELNRQLVYRVLPLNLFMVFCRYGQIVDPTGKTSVRSQDLEHVYLRVHLKITELLEAHAKKRLRPAPKVPARHEHGLVGRNEIEVLLSEVWALKPLADRYASPFDLIAQMLQRALAERREMKPSKEPAERSGGSSTANSLAKGS